MTSSKCVRVRVHGRVQGVAFREHTRKKAMQLHLVGWVRNCPDGTVEVLVEGHPDQVDSLLSWLHIGSPFSRVSRVESAEEPARYSGDESFAIRHGP